MKTVIKTGILFRTALSILPVCIMCSACHRNTEDCAQVQICTEVYVTIGVYVQDAVSTPVLLDSLQIKLRATNESLPDENPDFSASNGYYVLVGDRSLKKLNKSGSRIQAKGYKNGKIMLDENYVIGHDCCHVLKFSGKDTVIVQ